MAQVLALMAAGCSVSVAIKDFYTILEEKVQTMVRKLETESLAKIKAIKEEAEIRLGGDNQSLIQWLRELDCVICEAEDVLDEYKYKRLEQQVLRKQHAYVRSFYSFSSYVHYKSRVETALKRLDQISSSVEDFIKLLSSDARANNRGAAHARVVITSELNEQLFGRDEEIDHVAKRLITPAMSDTKRRRISDEEDEQCYEILPIIGVGGVGKTGLASTLYNHQKIIKHFDRRMWVHLPEDFDDAKITANMVDQLVSDQGYPEIKNLDELQIMLREYTKEKRFLLVLDDVWYDDKSTELANKVRWKRLLAPLNHGQPGSKILITSRMKLVAKIFTCTTEPVVLKGLEYDACFALFSKYVSGVDDAQQTPPNEHLLEICKKIVAEKIVTRYGGLPLAVIVVAGTLRERLDYEEWSHISRIVDNTPEDVAKTAIMVSYQRLPQHLQRCVAHHSIFPIGIALSREYLVHSWIGEGLIIDSPEEKNAMTVEDIASGYLNELVSRSFFQCQDDGLFVLHDLIHEVADCVTKDVCMRIEGNTTKKEIPPTIKHLRIDVEKLDKYKKKICRLKNLRTLVFTCNHSSDIQVPIGNDLICEILQKTKRLRVLRLASCHIKELPEWIGDLQHLRLLDLSNLQVKRLPRSVRRLYHLLYLDLTNFKADSMPSSLSKLINLRRIMSDAATLDRFGKTGKLTVLQQLPGFSVKKKKGHEIGELKKLNKLQGELRISNLQNVRRRREAAGAKLKKKTCLHKLSLEWKKNDGSASISDPVEEVLDELEPPYQVNELEIIGYAGQRPPIWMQRLGHSLPCLQVLILNKWPGTLPPLGQSIPQVRQLELRDCSKLHCLPPLPLNLEKLLLSGSYSLALLTKADLVKGYAQEMKAGFHSRPVSVIEEEVSITETLKKNNFAMEELKRVMKAGFHSRPVSVIVEEVRVMVSLMKNNRAMAELKRVTDLLEPASGFAPDRSSSSSLLASLRSWGLSRKHEAIQEKLTSKTEYADGNAQPLPSSLQQLHLGNCFVDDTELLNCIRRLTSLTRLVLAGCYCITSLPSKKVLRKLRQVQELRIEDCVLLTSLGGLRALPSLRVLNICSCPNLLALILSEKDEGSSSSPATALLPESLIDLAITDCELMDNYLVSRCLTGLTRLKHLSLQKLKCMTSLPSAEELAHLTSLEILILNDCEELVSMGGLHVLISLHSLQVHHCPGLINSEATESSQSIPSVTVDNISVLQALLSKKDLASLKVLSIVGQDIPFTSMQEECLEHLTSLQTLSFKNCEKLSSLPSNIQRLTSLKRLEVENCPQINSIPLLPTSVQVISDR